MGGVKREGEKPLDEGDQERERRWEAGGRVGSEREWQQAWQGKCWRGGLEGRNRPKMEVWGRELMLGCAIPALSAAR